MSRLVSHLRRWLIGILVASSLFVVWSTWLALSVSSREDQIEVNVGLLRSLSSMGTLLREADRYPAAPDQWTALQAGYRKAAGAMARDNDTYRAIQALLPAVDGAIARVAALPPSSAADPQHALLVHGQLAEAQVSLEKAVDVVRARQAVISMALAGQWRQMVWLALISCLIAAVLAILLWRYQQVVVFRMRVQKELEKSEEQFRALFEDAPVAYHELDTKGIVRRVNRAECQMLGYQRAEMLGKPAWSFAAPASQAESQRATREKLSGERPLAPFEREFARRDGAVLVLQVHERIILDHAGNLSGIRTAMLDITQRKKAEKDLRESASLLEATLEATADGILVVDLHGKIISHNQRFLDLWRIPPAMAVTRERSTLLTSVESQLTDPAHFRRAIAETYAVPAKESLDFLEFIDGRIFERSSKPQRVGAEIVGRVWTFRDLTAHRHAQQDLRASEERWQLALQGNNDGLWDWNARTNEVFHSARWKQILGYQEHEMPDSDQAWESRVHPEDFPRVQRELQDHLDRKTRFYVTEYRIRTRDGSYKWVLARGQALWDEAGNPVRMVGSHSDITERKAAEEALRRARDEAEAGNRAKSEFLANMSHEIRTPMAGVLGMIDLVLSTGITPQQKEYLDTARDSADSLLLLLNEILDLSKIEAKRLELAPVAFSIRQSVEGAVRLFAVRAQEKGLALTSTVEEDIPDMLVGDPLRIRQILLNLVGNAIKFTDAGSVAVRLMVESRTGSTVLIRVEVTDTGIGIPADKHQLVFDRFRQADGSMSRRHMGSGLGLTISAHLVDLMGGGIGLRSEEGTGSTFFFTVPLELANADLAGHHSGSEPSATPSANQPPAAAHGLRILLAEDNAVNQKLAALLLKREGHDVTVVGDGNEAVRAVAQDSFDVVLMDLQMPEMDGFEATAAIRAAERGTGRHLRIVALTAHAMKDDHDKCLDAGMDDYLTKPIDPARLRNALVGLAHDGS
jgi:PAS domain S-box-containing protein